MATKTAGTKATTGLTALQWQPSGMNATDFATLQELIKNPADNVPLSDSCRIENGILYVPGKLAPQGMVLKPGDWICVDALTGWVVVIPSAVMTAASTGWTHS